MFKYKPIMIRLIRKRLRSNFPIDGIAATYLEEEMKRLSPDVRYLKDDETEEEILEIDKVFYNNHKTTFALIGYRRVDV